MQATLNNGDKDFVTRFAWTGTRDFSAWFSFADAIDFRAAHGGEAAWMGYNNQLCAQVFDYLSQRWNVSRVVPGGCCTLFLFMFV